MPLENVGFYHHDVTKFVHVPGKLDYILHFASPASPIDYLKIPIETLKTDNLYFWRNSKGNKMDIVIDKGIEPIPVEIKSGETITKAYFKEMNYHLKSGKILLKALHARKFYPLEACLGICDCNCYRPFLVRNEARHSESYGRAGAMERHSRSYAPKL